MLNVKNIERRSKFLVKAIADKVKYDDINSPRFAYWVLYLDDNRKRPREIDTCATSYCISILEAEKQRTLANGSSGRFIYHDIIQCAIRTLLKLRGSNGAWPSVVEPIVLQEKKEYSGEVAINDNFFALTALLDAGFLNSQFEYTNNISNVLQSLDGRVEYVKETVEWLMNNRAKDNKGGWYYTNTADKKISVSVSISTTNVLTILNRIKNAIKGKVKYQKFFEYIAENIKLSNELLVDNVRSDGGIDSFISSKVRESSLLHTCKMIDALVLSEDDDYIDELSNAVEFVLKTCTKYPNCDFQRTPVDFYSETYNLVLPSEDEITIRHENFTEGLILYTLINMYIQYNQSGSYVSKISINVKLMKDIINQVIIQLDNMQTKDGEQNGLFKCHVVRSEGMHPVYSSFEGYRAFRMYMSLDKQIITAEEKNRMQEDIKKNQPFDPDSPYVFISYSHKDDESVLLDVQRLKTQFNCWIDFENIDGGRCDAEDDWTDKALPALENSNCTGVIMYISKKGFESNGLLREAEWIYQHKKNFYVFLVGFSNTLTPKDMAVIVDDIYDDDKQRRLRRVTAFSYIGQIDKDSTEFSYYHRMDNFSHLDCQDFHNWIRKIGLM